MTLHTRSTEQISPTESRQTQSWKWEKKHWLLVIAVSCFLLFWFGGQITKLSGTRTAIDWLPVLGTVAFAAEKIIKLTY